MALFWRIWTAIILVNLVVLALLVGLATLRFDSINSGLIGERLAVLADRTAAPFEAAAKIGLPLSGVRNADALLERARQTDDAILAIHVFDNAGNAVHSTVAPPPTKISPEAIVARQRAGGAPWHLETADGFLSSVDIPASGGETAGGILIVYPGGGNVTRVRAMSAELGLVAIAVVLVVAVVSAGLLWLGLRRQIRTFEGIENAIADFERGSWRSAAAGEMSLSYLDDRTEELGELLDDAEERYRAIGEALTAARESER